MHIRDAWLAAILVLIMALYALTLSGCSSFPQSLTEERVINKYDLYGTVNGVPFDGIGVIPPAASYKLRIESKQDVDLITITSCHREFSAESVIDTGWFRRNRGFEYTYVPAPGIENVGSCLLRLGTYNKSVPNQNAHAVIDFMTPAETLPVTSICNGSQNQSVGVSLCQSKAGLVQRLRFWDEVSNLSPDKAVAPMDGSKICAGKWVEPLVFEYTLIDGECTVAFMEKLKPHRLHRHTAIGYTKVQIRGK